MHDLARVLSRIIETSSLSIFLQNLKNEVPITQSIHLLGICFIVGSSAMIDLRVLGLMHRDEPVRAVTARFMPPLWGGLALVAATGFVMILTEPSRSLPAIQFQFKMLALIVAVCVTALLDRLTRRQDERTGLGPAQILAVASLALWAAIIAAGRWIAYA